MRYITIGLTTAAALVLSALSAHAEADSPGKPAIELGAPFQDHAILQRGLAVPV